MAIIRNKKDRWDWKKKNAASAFLNLYVAQRTGTRVKLGSIPLRESRAVESALLSWIGNDAVKASKLVDKFILDFNSVSSSTDDFDDLDFILGLDVSNVIGFLNFHLPTVEGSARLNRIPLKYGNKFIETIANWLAQDEANADVLKTRLIVDYRSATPDVSRQEVSRQVAWKVANDEIAKYTSEYEKAFYKYNVKSLWHITHKDNIQSILQYGIVNHYNAHGLKLNHVDISNFDVQKWREKIEPRYNRRIHEYANLYINAQNSMLYALKDIQHDLCLIEVSLSVLSENNYLITDGNAASHDTYFYRSVHDLESLPWDILNNDYWHDFSDGKRKRCAEVLIYPSVLPEFITRIHCYSDNTANDLKSCGSDVFVTRKLFF